MTVNTTSTRELSIDKIVLRAAQLAKLMPPGGATTGTQWENLSAQARDFLEMIVDGLQAEGGIQRSVEFYDVTTVAGQASYDMPDTTVSLVGDGMYLQSTASTGQTVVKAVTRQDYQRISTKTSEGIPTLYYPQVHATVTVYLWPVPQIAGTLTLQRQRLFADNNDGSRTPDFERYWAQCLCYSVAHDLSVAAGMPNAASGYLRSMAVQSKASAMNKSASRAPSQIVNTHSSGWNR